MCLTIQRLYQGHARIKRSTLSLTVQVAIELSIISILLMLQLHVVLRQIINVNYE